MTSGPGISGEDAAKVMTPLPTGRLDTADEATDVIAFLGSPHANCMHDGEPYSDRLDRSGTGYGHVKKTHRRCSGSGIQNTR